MDENDIELTPAQLLMVQSHEMFLSAQHAGFTQAEALYLVATVMCGGPRLPPERDE